MRQPYHHGALREALLTAAEDILERYGLEALTLRAIARQVGVSPAAPKPHFGDLTGLLTALATSGFVRMHGHLTTALAQAGSDHAMRLAALGQSYVAFAHSHPGLFRLMLRSERPDWSNAALAAAGQAALALLTEDRPDVDAPTLPRNFDTLVLAMSRWSLMHGLATLLVDGRIGPLVAEAPGGDVETLINKVLGRQAMR